MVLSSGSIKMLKGAWPNTLVMHTLRVIFVVINAIITTKRTIMLQHKRSFGCDCVAFITTVDNMLSLCTLDAWTLETTHKNGNVTTYQDGRWSATSWRRHL